MTTKKRKTPQQVDVTPEQVQKVLDAIHKRINPPHRFGHFVIPEGATIRGLGLCYGGKPDPIEAFDDEDE